MNKRELEGSCKTDLDRIFYIKKIHLYCITLLLKLATAKTLVLDLSGCYG